MSAKQRYQVHIEYKSKKTILSMLEKTEAIQVSSSPVKSGGFNVMFSVKKAESREEIEDMFSNLRLNLEKING